jgi:hypothetical protein
LPPLAEDRRAAILGLRRHGKTGPEIYAAFGVDTEQERQQIRRFLQQQARREPALALRNPPTFADEIAAAKSEAKPPEDYIRQDDYYLLRYWAEKWASPPTPEVLQVVELLQEGQSIAEIVFRTGLTRNRVKYIRSALQSGRMRAAGLAESPGSPADPRCEPAAQGVEHAASADTFQGPDQERAGSDHQPLADELVLDEEGPDC